MNTNQASPIITRSHIYAVVFFAIFLFLLYQTATILAPFYSALLWAAILALALHPTYTRVLALVRGRAGLAAGITTLGIVFLIIGPAILLLAVLSAQALDLYQWASALVQSGRLTESWSGFAGPLLAKISSLPVLADVDVKGFLIKGVSELSSSMASQLGGILINTFVFLVNLLIMLLCLFFFFRNGETYYRSAMELLPFTEARRQSITRKFHDTFVAVINGVFVIALVQGIMTGIGFSLFGVPLPVFWGFIAALLALLPIGGAAIVWIPAAIYLSLTGATLPAIFLGIWGVVLVSLPDNFLKPLLIGRKAKLPTFFLFIGILGGLKTYGFLGILFGPLVVTLLIAFIQIYREEFAGQ